jgi:hypothetical protein
MRSQLRVAGLIAAFVAMLMTVPSLAHHSFIAQFDPSKAVKYSGAVTKVTWSNPHAFFTIDVKGEDGAAVSWRVELGSPNTLIRYGWTRNTLKIGDVVTVEGYLARDGSNLMNAKEITMPDGSVINAGSSFVQRE